MYTQHTPHHIIPNPHFTIYVHSTYSTSHHTQPAFYYLCTLNILHITSYPTRILLSMYTQHSPRRYPHHIIPSPHLTIYVHSTNSTSHHTQPAFYYLCTLNILHVAIHITSYPTRILLSMYTQHTPHHIIPNPHFTIYVHSTYSTSLSTSHHTQPASYYLCTPNILHITSYPTRILLPMYTQHTPRRYPHHIIPSPHLTIYVHSTYSTSHHTQPASYYLCTLNILHITSYPARILLSMYTQHTPHHIIPSPHLTIYVHSTYSTSHHTQPASYYLCTLNIILCYVV